MSFVSPQAPRLVLANDPGFAVQALDATLSLSLLVEYVNTTMNLPYKQTTVYEARKLVREAPGLRTHRDHPQKPEAALADSFALPPAVPLSVDGSPALAPVGENETRTTTGNSMSVTLPCTLVQTEEQLMEHCQIDRSRWYVDAMKVKAYQGYIKNAQKEIEKTQLYSIQATLKRHKGVEEAARIIADMLADAHAHAPVYTPVSYPSFASGEGHLLELALFDAHVGKMCWAPETGSHYDIAAARAAFLGAVDYLVGMASGFKIERILLPLGNDFFNSEGKSRATTNGTPQEDVCRWQQSFTEGRRLVIEAIDRLRCVAPVDVVMVPGNHDAQRVFHLGEVLEAWYRNDECVGIDNAPSPRKYYVYGDCLTMFTHGDEENARDLPNIMATGARALWGAAKFCEIHTGHFHKRKETKFVDIDENSGTRIRVLPSLSGTDAWHHGKGYTSRRGAEALIYHPTRGNVGNFSHNLV
jgi:hypothetical protein